MEGKASVIEMPELRLIVNRTDDFPEGIKAAWDNLESKLATLKGRKFYGLTYLEKSKLVYYAGVIPLNDEEVAALGFPVKVVEGGRFAKVKLMDWSNHIEQIGKIFDELRETFTTKPGPSIEYYRSHTELHLLLPLVEAAP